MAPQHTGPELFEVIRRRADGERDDRTMQVPEWWSQPSGGDGRGPTQGWLTTPVRLHLNRAMLLGGVVVVLAMVVVGYQFGRAERGPDQPLMATESQQSVRDLAGPTAPGQGASAAATGVAAARASGAETNQIATQPPENAAYVDQPERVPGYNYFCLETLGMEYRTEAQQVVDFLRANGVDARVFEVQNRWLQVVAMRGFERSTSPAARDYENLLRSLGRVWKAERRGWSDWKDLYAIKYRPRPRN